MTTYVLRRLAQMVPLLLGVTVVLFAVIQAAPGGPEAALLGSGRAVDPELVRAYRERLGVDRPVPVQYARWLAGAVQGDLGASYSTGRPVSDMILERLPATLELMGAAFALAAVLAFGLGLLGAVRQGTGWDHAAAGVSFLGLAMPVFWLALLLQLVFGVWLGWLPVAGTGAVGDGSLGGRLAHLVLPAAVLSSRYVAGWSRYLRASLAAALRADYVRTARAKGLPERVVVGVHALRNALLPVVSVMALNLAELVSGAVITETVFAWPGIGRMFVQGMFARDYPLLMGILLLGSAMVVVCNLVADVVLAALDPRVRYD